MSRKEFVAAIRAFLVGLPRGVATSLLAKVHAAARAHDHGNLEATLEPLGALLNQINALDAQRL